jgi:GH24 family phage-related lysozyme (muramidase)
MPHQIVSLIDLIKFEEDSSFDGEPCKHLTAYLDDRGNLTGPYGVTGPMIGPGMTWTQPEADAMFEIRLGRAVADAAICVGPSWGAMDEVRQGALSNMAYQLGRSRLMGFYSMLAFVRDENWVNAAVECLASIAARQAPARWNRNADMLQSGQWPLIP